MTVRSYLTAWCCGISRQPAPESSPHVISFLTTYTRSLGLKFLIEPLFPTPRAWPVIAALLCSSTQLTVVPAFTGPAQTRTVRLLTGIPV